MSNKFGGIFTIILSLSLCSLQADPTMNQDSLLQVAESQFEYEQYPAAIAIYESLYETGFYQEQMLYRLAFMHEQLGQFPESIFYLRKLQWEIGGEHLDEKINDLMDKTSQERLSTGEGWTAYRLFLKRFQTTIFISIGVLILLAIVLLLIRHHRWTYAISALMATIALTLAGLLVEQDLRTPTKAVVMQPTLFYELPAFAADHKSLPIGPGATVNIKAEQDIWYHISMGQFESWVPKAVIRKL